MVIARFLDGLANLVSGAGTTADKRTHGFYVHCRTDPGQIEAAYRSSWLMRKVCDIPPFDMTRAGRDWQCDSDTTTKIEAEEKRLGLWAKVQHALVLGRLGGGLIVMGVGREDPALPLNARSVQKGGLRYLHVMNRWQVTLGQLVTDPADDLFGQPRYFEIQGQGKATTRIHPSRVVCFKGRRVPALYGSTGDDWFWGDPELTSTIDAIRNADAAQNGFASLIEEAKVDTVSIPQLTNLVSTADGEAMLLKRISIANSMKSMHNTRILDGGNGTTGSGETWETRQIAWAGMPDMIRTYLAIVAGAADIPATRLLGKSPDGQNATGAGDEANYFAMIAARQENDLRPALEQVDVALVPSAGVTPGPDVWFRFAPLAIPSEAEEAATFKTWTEAATATQALAAIPDVAFTKAVQTTVTERGWMPGLDGALAEIPEQERFGIEQDDDDEEDPSAIVPLRIAANDAKPRTLYVSRKVLNVSEIAAWAKEQALPTLDDDLHVTIAYSTTQVDWITMGATWVDASGKGAGDLVVTAGGPRVVEPLGNRTAVLMFASSDLSWRNREMREAGASWDFPDYQPHISLTGEPVNLANVQPYRGKILLGPEIFEEIRTGEA